MEKLIGKLSELYPGLAFQKSFGKVSGGYLSDNFAVGNDKIKYFLRQYRSKYNKKENEQIHRIKNFFAKNGIPIISPLKNKNGKTFFEFDGKFYALFPFIEGKVIEAKDLTIKTIHSIARMLAKIHLLSKNGFPELTEDRTSIYSKEKIVADGEKILSLINAKRKKDEFDEQALCQIALKLDLVKQNNITFEDLGLKFDHLIHGDFHEMNLFYDQNNEVKFVYDLEKATVAPRSFEIARAIDYICLTDFKDINIIRAAEFVKAYRSLYEISDEEIRKGLIFWYMKNIHNLWIEEAHYLQNNFRTDVFYPIQDKKLRFYSQHLDKVINNILEKSHE